VYKDRFIIPFILLILVLSGSSVNAGLKESLNKELTSLIEKTEPYLVTVKGDGIWRNLIAAGIVYNEEGYVITSSPAYPAADYEVNFANGETYDAEPVGVDHETGLAVLKIKGKRQFQIPTWGSLSSLNEGDWVLFVGNSYDNPSSVNIGTYGGKDDDGFLELNLNVNPASSGGAVFNADGEVIGILIPFESSPGLVEFYRKSMNLEDRHIFISAARSDEKTLAISADQAKEIAEELIEYGENKRGFLGIGQKDLTNSQKKEYDIEGGVLITDVVDDSPADDAGLREDDIIIEIDGRTIEGTGDLYRRIRSYKPGDEISITYIREGDKKKVDIELGESKHDYFLGSLDSDKIFPKLKAAKLLLPDAEDLEDELRRLKDEFEKLRLELDELKDNLKK